MNLIRIAITAAEVLGCMAAINLAALDHCIVGFLVAFAMVMLAWMEGHRGWGSSLSQAERS